jgi:hypothetical protein
MSDAETKAMPDLQQPAAIPAGAASSLTHLQLPDFWPDTPQAWFIFVESEFRVRGILSEADRFDLVVGSLPKESLPAIEADGPHAGAMPTRTGKE